MRRLINIVEDQTEESEILKTLKSTGLNQIQMMDIIKNNPSDVIIDAMIDNCVEFDHCSVKRLFQDCLDVDMSENSIIKFIKLGVPLYRIFDRFVDKDISINLQRIMVEYDAKSFISGMIELNKPISRMIQWMVAKKCVENNHCIYSRDFPYLDSKVVDYLKKHFHIPK